MILYIPANVYPVMTVISFGRGEPSTILGGVRELFLAGMWASGVNLDELVKTPDRFDPHNDVCLRLAWQRLTGARVLRRAERQHRARGGQCIFMLCAHATQKLPRLRNV